MGAGSHDFFFLFWVMTGYRPGKLFLPSGYVDRKLEVGVSGVL